MNTKAVARVAVTFYLDAESLRDAEKTITYWLSAAQEDDRLKVFAIDWARTDWTPEFMVPVSAEVDS